MVQSEPDRLKFRGTFGLDPTAYDRWRPRYVSALFDDLAELTGITSDGIALEIGCGTGQVTRVLDAMVGRLHVVDIAEELLHFTRDALRDPPKVHWHHGPFEALELPAHSLDLIVAASSFHWVDPDVRYTRTAQLLRAGGSLAIIGAHQLDGGTPGFFEATQELYVKYLDDDPEFRLPREVDLSGYVGAIADSAGYEPAIGRVYEVQQEFGAEAWSGLLGTQSPMLALPERARLALQREMSATITDRFGGSVTRRMAYSLVTARRVDDA
ncbi:MAG: methyltransferase [Thermoleophilia bacterium]|nr:methyltransferase [Thermoleophilia bacterium]